MMKKILLTITLFTLSLFALSSFALTAAKDVPANTFLRGQVTEAGTTYPTDIYVYNYNYFMNEYVTVMTPEAPLPNYTIYPKPINPYYDHIYNTQFHINMRIVLKNRFNQIFFDEYVGDFATIEIYESKERSGLPRVVINDKKGKRTINA